MTKTITCAALAALMGCGPTAALAQQKSAADGIAEYRKLLES